MYGTVMALALLDLMDAALTALEAREPYDTKSLMNELRAEEDKDYDRFHQSLLTDEARVNILVDPAIDMALVARERPLCRTNRLPAQARYLGIMTDDTCDKISYTGYEMGIDFEQARLNPAKPDGPMRLAYDTPHDARNCPIPLNQDFKDFYLVTPNDGWQSLVFPNDHELEYYRGKDQGAWKGLVMIALASCGWHCPTGDLREDAIASGAVELEVNGIKVTNSTTASGGTFLKHGAEGENAYFPPNEQGRYVFRARAFGEGTFLRLSGIAVW
jgi:hypothetical protein